MDADVIIVGAGPAGASTALFLAASGFRASRILILERHAFPREKICAGAIGGRALRALLRIGVEAKTGGVPIYGLKVRVGDRALEHRHHDRIGTVVRRVDFDHALAREATGRGIRLMERTQVTAIDVRPDRVSVQTNAGALTSRVVVGADGVGSIVRRELGIARGALWAQAVEVDTPYLGDEDTSLLVFDLTCRELPGYAWDFPTLVDGQPMVSRGLYELVRPSISTSTRKENEVRGELSARLFSRLASKGIRTAGLSVRRFAERGLSVHEPMSRPRAMLVGEAAGIDPVLGEGIAQAILYGSVAGPYLARALTHDSLSFSDWPDAFRRSRLGWDLALRARVLRGFYGPLRPAFEELLLRSDALASSGAHYFAGERVPRAGLARAFFDLFPAAYCSMRETAV